MLLKIIKNDELKMCIFEGKDYAYSTLKTHLFYHFLLLKTNKYTSLFYFKYGFTGKQTFKKHIIKHSESVK